MPGTHVYVYLPESDPGSTPWTRLNTDYLEDTQMVKFLGELDNSLASIEHENTIGKYDSHNINAFLRDPDLLDDYYPRSARKILRNILREYIDCRPDIESLSPQIVTLFGQKIIDHCFCAIAKQLATQQHNENTVLLNFYSITINNEITLTFENTNYTVINIKNKALLESWFYENRRPVRIFHDTKKHRQNDGGNWQGASKLLCNQDHAQQLLNSAIGEKKKALFNYDKSNNSWIKFMNDNTTGAQGETLYHGYHLDIDSMEIPDKVKKKLLARHQ